MKFNVKVLDSALDKFKYWSAGSEAVTDVEITFHHEDLEGGKLGDFMVIKAEYTKINKYNNNQEEKITRTCTVPASNEGVGKKFECSTWSTEIYDLEEKKKKDDVPF